MSDLAYRGQSNVNAEVVHVFKSDAKLKWMDDGLLSTFCVPYNHFRPMNDIDELKDDDIAKEGDLTKTYTGSMFDPYVWLCCPCCVPNYLPSCQNYSSPHNKAEIFYDVCGSVS